MGHFGGHWCFPTAHGVLPNLFSRLGAVPMGHFGATGCLPIALGVLQSLFSRLGAVPIGHFGATGCLSTALGVLQRPSETPWKTYAKPINFHDFLPRRLLGQISHSGHPFGNPLDNLC